MDKKSAYEYIRSKYVRLSETRKLIKTHGLKIKYGFLSDAEASSVRKTLDKFLKDRNLQLKDLQRHLVEDTEFPIHDLLYECTQACELRTFKSIHTHLAYMYHPFIHAPWNEQDEMHLLNLVNQKGFRWKEISYHLSKYKDLCRLRYLSLKGEAQERLSRSQIETILQCMPSTDEEWVFLCKQLKNTKRFIMASIEKYMKGKELKRGENSLLDIVLCFHVLNNNHYCKFNIDIAKILNYLEADIESYGFFDTAYTPETLVIPKKGRRTVINVETCKEDERNSNEFEDELETTLKNIKKATSENIVHTRFLSSFLNLVNVDPDFNLDIEIDTDEIFWFNITREMNILKQDTFVKFNQLKKMYNWKTFKDIYDTLFKLAYDYVVKRIKINLIKKECKIEPTEEEKFNNTEKVENLESEASQICKEESSIVKIEKLDNVNSDK